MLGARLLGLFVLALGAGVVACSSTSHQTSGDAGSSVSGQSLPDASFVDGSDSLCATDPRGETYSQGLEARGAAGALNVLLESVSVAPPQKGNNEWTVQVVDPSGAPVDGLTITVVPFMPDHLHGTSITPQVAALGGGRYDVTLLNLFMPGIWTVTFSLGASNDAGGHSVLDSAVFTFCISG